MPALATDIVPKRISMDYGINGFTDLASKNLGLSIAALILRKYVGFWIIMLISN